MQHYDIFRKTLKRCLGQYQDIQDIRDYSYYVRRGETYKINIRGLVIPCMTKDGFFIINGKTWVVPWKEMLCPNWIYKGKGFINVWSAPLETPWKLYDGRLRVFIKKGMIFVETKKTDILLKEFLDFHHISFDELDGYMKRWTHVYDKFTRHTATHISNKKPPNDSNCLPHLKTNKQKTIFLALMILHLLDDSIPEEKPGLHSKRLISCEWLIRQTCHIYKNDSSKAYGFITKRILSQGQLLDLKCKHEILSHTTRVIRTDGSTFGSTYKRELQEYHRGIYCPYRASEGENIGLVVDLAVDVKISIYLEPELDPDLDLDLYPDSDNVIVNGVINSDTIPYESVRSITWKWTDAGRVVSKRSNSIGVIAQSIIFRRHLPPVRTMYATTHIRQAIPLVYPQIPVIQGKGLSPNGQNVCVAVCSFEGWNIEDAIVCKAEFVKRGGLSTLNKSIIQESVGPGERWLSDTPLPKNTNLRKKSTMFSKTSKTSKTNDTRKWENDKVAKVLHSHRNDKTEVLELLTLHYLETGDKLSTRSGQKGVIGKIIPSKDMPYTRDGLVPDLIINPAHMPSRMTVSQMLESYFGKELIIQGKTAIENIESNPHFDTLCDKSGKEYMYCGKTGNKLRSPVFIGSVFYMPLQHMVHKKIRARNKGPIVPITGQPTQGRQAHGGLRVGEMERDALRTRNCREIIKERLGADIINVMVCKSCGWLEPTEKCCQDTKHVQIKMPKTTRLLLMEIYALGIFPKLNIG